MKKLFNYLMIVVLVGLVTSGLWHKNAIANFSEQFQDNEQSVNWQQAVETPVPTVIPDLAAIETPESRVLPPVGRNAGLVIGASVLVLIIIGGVLSSRRKQNH